MIYLYSGTPGSGKSLHTARDIVNKLRRKQNVIANFAINLDIVKDTWRTDLQQNIIKKLRLKKKAKKYQRKIGSFTYKDNSELTVDYLIEYAKKNHKYGKEGQTLLIIDECAVLFNSRTWGDKGRNAWINFFLSHRKYGYNLILVSQSDRLIDRQIRAFIEYDVKHRKANNLGTIGLLISLFRLQLFAAVSYWYGVHEKCGMEFFTYKKMYSQIYDSYGQFQSV